MALLAMYVRVWPGRSLHRTDLVFQEQRTGSYNVGDSVSMHLLMENALEDSNKYEVMSPDDVDAARRELDALVGRIEATQRKLVLETKVRDASQTMNRLDKIEEANEAAARCDELVQEIFRLQSQEQQLQRQLLQHTAGVLQMTHKGYLRDGPDPAETNGDALDHAQFYEPSMLLESLDGPSKPSAEQQQLIGDLQTRVEDMNGKIRGLLLELNPGPQNMPGPVPQLLGQDADSVLLEQVSYLDGCLNRMQRAQMAQKESLQQAQAAAEQAQLAAQQSQMTAQQSVKGRSEETARALGNFNSRLYQTVTRNGTDQEFKLAPPPSAEGSSVDSQVHYLGSINECMQLQLDKTDKYDSVIGGLWEVLAVPEQDGDFSLQKFSAKIQEMNIRFSSLQEQKAVLTRQIQQQRELNESGDAAKDKQFRDLQDQLDQTRGELDNAKQETDIHLGRLTDIINELEATKKSLDESQALAQSTVQSSTQGLEAERLARKHAEDQLQKANAQLEETSNLMEVNSLALKTDIEGKAEAIAKAENDLREMEGRFVELQTELTITKAELDGAHGTRAQRAAEAAGSPELQERIQTLENELRETITDYESMTKATIEHEKEREQLESLVDGLRDRVESLEAQLNEERIGAMGMKSPGGTTGGTTSASVLRNEFKKMMKEARDQHQKTLRVSWCVVLVEIRLTANRTSKKSAVSWKPRCGR